MKYVRSMLLLALGLMSSSQFLLAQGTRLLRQPSLSETHIAFAYGGDIWVSPRSGGNALRITSTAAVESHPHISPDGKTIAFTSNRSGSNAVYTVSINGGAPQRLTWHPSPCGSRGWTKDGSRVLYASTRDAAPTSLSRLWTVAKDGGPSTQLIDQWAFNGSYSPDGSHMVIDKISRWDEEWRDYRGGQNTPLIVLSLSDLSETLIPNERTTDILPVWIGDQIYFLSDRDGVSNIWSYSPETQALKQLSSFRGADIKWLDGRGDQLVFEREGFLHLMQISSGAVTQLSITCTGDFPWAETKWEEVSDYIESASLSPTGKRAIFEARGEIFTVPVEYGDARNLTQSAQSADRAPMWSPKGEQIAWFSDAGGKGYQLMIANQDGLSAPRSISIGESKMAWEPTWSPEGKSIAFVDDDLRLRVIDIESGSIQTVDVGGSNIERGEQGLTWSTDGQWLAYSKTGKNNFRSIMIWSKKDNSIHAVTDPFADASSPAWDRDGQHLYFLASTNLALASGWANTSSITADPEYAVYVMNLRKEDPS
ncbi:MAG: protease, partial [Bacteroidia bacterium]|nr:protease [Bacteroidia bacterium]